MGCGTKQGQAGALSKGLKDKPDDKPQIAEKEKVKTGCAKIDEPQQAPDEKRGTQNHVSEQDGGNRHLPKGGKNEQEGKGEDTSKENFCDSRPDQALFIPLLIVARIRVVVILGVTVVPLFFHIHFV